MFIFTKPVHGINSGDEPFLPLPPYDPKTGENLPGIPIHHARVRPRIRKEEVDIVSRLKQMSATELEKFLSRCSEEDITELVKELLERIKK